MFAGTLHANPQAGSETSLASNPKALIHGKLGQVYCLGCRCFGLGYVRLF